MSAQVRGGRGPLLAIAILHAVGAVVLLNCSSEHSPARVRDAFTLDAGVNFSLAAVFLGLWYWAARNPVGASQTGLALFLGGHVAAAFLNPASLVIGIVVKAVVLFFLVRSVIAARAARAWERMEPKA